MTLIYLGVVLAMFGETFLRGFQSKNMQNEHMKLAVAVGFVMTLLEMLVVVVVAKHGGILMAVLSAAGAAAGWASAMTAHKLLMRRKIAALKREKKRKRVKRMHKIIAKEMARYYPQSTHHTFL